MKTIEQYIDLALIGYTCRKYNISDYVINMDGSVNVNTNVDLSSSSLYQIPINFNTINGDFICTHNHLHSLINAPKIINGSFICSHNQLINLNNSPDVVGGDFICDNNLLDSLSGAPKKIGGLFDCSYNKLESLENISNEVNGLRFDHNMISNMDHYPINMGDLYCCDNNLKSFDNFSEKIYGSLMCYNNQIESLNGCPQHIESHFDISNNRLTSLDGAPKYVGGISTYNENPLPRVILSIINHNLNITTFIKYQDYYQVWDKPFNQKGAISLLIGIIEGLK